MREGQFLNHRSLVVPGLRPTLGTYRSADLNFRIADRELDVFGQRQRVVGGQIRGSASIASVHLCHPNFAQPVYVHQLGDAHQTFFDQHRR